MMVLFLKHVHLQNLGAAGSLVLSVFAGFHKFALQRSLQEAEASAMSAARRSTSSWIRAMAVLDAANRTCWLMHRERLERSRRCCRE